VKGRVINIRKIPPAPFRGRGSGFNKNNKCILNFSLYLKGDARKAEEFYL
jgi:hypothetical protein